MAMSIQAPIAIFIYRRPEHLRRTLLSLGRCRGFEGSPIIVFSDGPRDASESAEVEATRRVARELLDEHTEYVFSDLNLGLAQSVIRGVSQTLGRFGRVIVLEDDLEVAPNFLEFMNAALDRYANETSVMQVSGYLFDVPEFVGRQDAFFLPLTVSWGWATWQRAWKSFDPSATDWEQLNGDADLRRRFNLDGAYDYSAMLLRQMTGKTNSWAIRWYWTVFKSSGLTLFPPQSLVRNTGADGSGTHGRGWLRRFSAGSPVLSETTIRLPSTISVLSDDFAVVKKSVARMNGGWAARLFDRLRRVL